MEVLVGGVRMRYPSCYVLVTDMDDTPPDTPLSPPSSPASCEHPLLGQQELRAATELPERVWAECTLGSPIPTSKTESSIEPGTWTFIDRSNAEVFLYLFKVSENLKTTFMS